MVVVFLLRKPRDVVDDIGLNHLIEIFCSDALKMYTAILLLMCSQRPALFVTKAQQRHGNRASGNHLLTHFPLLVWFSLINYFATHFRRCFGLMGAAH